MTDALGILSYAHCVRVQMPCLVGDEHGPTGCWRDLHRVLYPRG